MTVAAAQPQSPRVKRWSKQEYNEQVEQGWFEGKRRFLFRGELIEMPAVNSPHAWAVMKLRRKLTKAFPDHEIRIQLPFEVSLIASAWKYFATLKRRTELHLACGIEFGIHSVRAM